MPGSYRGPFGNDHKCSQSPEEKDRKGISIASEVLAACHRTFLYPTGFFIVQGLAISVAGPEVGVATPATWTGIGLGGSVSCDSSGCDAYLTVASIAAINLPVVHLDCIWWKIWTPRFFGDWHSSHIPGSSRYVKFLPFGRFFGWKGTHFTHKRKIQVYFLHFFQHFLVVLGKNSGLNTGVFFQGGWAPACPLGSQLGSASCESTYGYGVSTMCCTMDLARGSNDCRWGEQKEWKDGKGETSCTCFWGCLVTWSSFYWKSTNFLMW